MASTDAYGAGGAAKFLEEAAAANLWVLISTSFPNNANDFSDQINALKSVDARVILIFCQTSDAGASPRPNSFTL